MASIPVTVSIDEELLGDVDEFVSESQDFRNRSHLVEVALNRLLVEEEFYEEDDG